MSVRRCLSVLPVLMVAMLSACGKPAAPPRGTGAGLPDDVRSVRATSIDSSIPAPSGKAILTIQGKIGNTNTATALDLDLATLEKFRLVEADLFEPWVKQRVSFRGVLLSDVVAAAQPDPDATSIHMVALDDYVADFSLKDLRSAGIILATRDAGAEIPISKGGPTRVVFPDSSKLGKDSNLWIWNVRSIEVR